MRQSKPGMSVIERLLEWYFGIEPAGSGEGTDWRLSLEGADVFSGWRVVLLLVCAVCVVLIYSRELRRVTGTARWLLPMFRLLALLLVAFWFGELTLHAVRTGLPTLIVMIDTSASMGLDDRYSGEEAAAAGTLTGEPGTDRLARLALAKSILLQDEGRLLAQLAEDYRLKLYTFAESAEPLVQEPGASPDRVPLESIRALTADGANTSPGASLKQVLDEHRGAPPAAIVVLTDGVSSTGDNDRLSAAAESAVGRTVPVFPIGLGTSKPTRDVQIYDLLADSVVFVEDPVTFELQAKAYDYSGESVEVVVRESDRNEILAREEVRVPGDGVAVPLRLTFTPREEGDYEFIVEARPVPGETNLENNVLRRRVRVQREQIRVLLVDRAPRWEYRHLKAVLEFDDAVSVATVLQESDPAYQEEDRTALAAFPAAQEELFEYDVIILGDVDLQYLNPGALDSIRAFVSERGGGLILIAGESHNPLAFRGSVIEPLVPVELDTLTQPAAATSGFRIKPTRAGFSSPIFQLLDGESANRALWGELPPIYWAVEAPRRRPAALVLAAHSSRHTAEGRLPMIVLQRFGAGQVLFHATDELWRWRRQVENQFYGRYWSQAVRFLSRSRLLGGVRGVELTSDRQTYVDGETIRLRLRFVDQRLVPKSGEPVTVILEHHDGRQVRVELSRRSSDDSVFEGSVSNATVGSYHAWLAAPTFPDAPPACDFLVELPQRELQERAADPADLARAAAQTGGTYLDIAAVGRIPEVLPRGKAVAVADADSIPLWSRVEVLLAFVGLLACEWTLRKRLRLV